MLHGGRYQWLWWREWSNHDLIMDSCAGVCAFWSAPTNMTLSGSACAQQQHQQYSLSLSPTHSYHNDLASLCVNSTPNTNTLQYSQYHINVLS